MNATIKSFVFAMTLLGVGLVSSSAQAQVRTYLRVAPGPDLMGGTPRLGILGHFDWGHGMHVDSVMWGTPAQQMGLEPGDVIRSINGRWLRTESDYFVAMSYSGSHVRVLVEDVRTGALVPRIAHLHGGIVYGSGPISAYSHRAGSIR